MSYRRLSKLWSLFGYPIIIRHLIFGYPKKALILTTTHMNMDSRLRAFFLSEASQIERNWSDMAFPKLAIPFLGSL